jgi:broad specificity phosphatase PhoE
VLVISHGGPIAALRWHAAGLPIARLPEFIPAMGAIVDDVVRQ